MKNGKFLVVGSNSAALKLRGPNTRVVDLNGSFVVPGFNDNHVHFASAAQFLEFNIMRAATQDQFVTRVKEVIGRLPKGEWIVGGYWGASDEWAAGSTGNQRREPFAFTSVRDSIAGKSFPIRAFASARATSGSGWARSRVTSTASWARAPRVSSSPIHTIQNRGRWRPLMVNDKGEFVGKFLKYMLDAAPKEFLTTDTLYTIIAGKVVYQNQNPNP